MTYAVFSDIHGNYPAFKAALADARAQKAGHYILLGDYLYGFPWGNDVAETIMNLENRTVIRGNGEGYLIDLLGKDETGFIYEQFKPVYWAYRTLSEENLRHLINLPETETILCHGHTLHLYHSLHVFYRKPMIDLFHYLDSRTMAAFQSFTHADYLGAAREAVLSRPDAVADILALPPGIYLFGHNHKQFFMEHENRLFINPGSCGEPLDWDTAAPYTLLTVENGGWSVEERRVPYDLRAVAQGFEASGYLSYAPEWSDIMIRELMTGKNYFHPFVMHLLRTGRDMGRTEYPVGNDVWDAAVKTWDADGLEF